MPCYRAARAAARVFFTALLCRATLDYMAMLNGGGAAPAEQRSGVWDGDDAASGEETPRRKSIWDK